MLKEFAFLINCKLSIFTLLLCVLQRKKVVVFKLRIFSLKPCFLDEGPGERRDCALGYDEKEDVMFVFGGKDKKMIYNDIWYYDFKKHKWGMVNTTIAPEKRFTMAFGVWNRTMLISTGEGPGKVFYNDVWRLVYYIN